MSRSVSVSAALLSGFCQKTTCDPRDIFLAAPLAAASVGATVSADATGATGATGATVDAATAAAATVSADVTGATGGTGATGAMSTSASKAATAAAAISASDILFYLFIFMNGLAHDHAM